ncbi:hypothetical protein B4114_0481 [Geobacillus stearothermophilus]|uniref:Uncharacterized protein n=1 Tax=Geobacillus stearothermophilus TaxID=1422 RepID=A0A150N7M4_GEOSE|nr:hypothetical protein B4114_0481 [Geobacillus stearothermophilus]
MEKRPGKSKIYAQKTRKISPLRLAPSFFHPPICNVQCVSGLVFLYFLPK